MFDLLLHNLRAQGVKVGLGEWMVFLDGLRKGLVHDSHSLYRFGRAVLVHTETQYDAWDLAFQATFEGVELEPKLKEELEQWLADAAEATAEEKHWDLDPDELRRRFYETMEEQQERHEGGSRWVGTGGNSPFGHSGKGRNGMRVGGGGGGRSALQVAGERQWKDYRTDTRLDHRDLQVALTALRNLGRDGPLELDVDRTIRKTADNAGDIDLHWQRARRNRIHLRLIMDTGGSMAPHTRLVTQLFTAAEAVKGYKSFEALFFHNAPYGTLWRKWHTNDKVHISTCLREWPEGTRLIFVGDASMASYELFEPWGDWQDGRLVRSASGLDWIQRLKRAFPASIWLNPDPPRWWAHPTVRAIGNTVPMFPLTLAGIRDGVKNLRHAA
jgi:uncharacterized protein with von Willebrand factor type A (vWA) domain